MHGIGKGGSFNNLYLYHTSSCLIRHTRIPAPGFQTNVRRLRVTPDIAARLRRGEEVSPEEIAASSVRAEEEERRGADATPPESKREEPKKKDAPSEPTNEWLPESITAPKKRAKGKKK